MGSEHYCLRWNNHQSNLLGVFSQLLQDESLVDVTLSCSEGAPIRAHKVVLSACSSYFQSLFLDHPERHPIVILKDVRFAELQTLVEFMYKGEVNVQYCQLSALLKTAESLKVKGLAEMTNQNTSLREPEREPDRLRTQPSKSTCDSPVDAALAGPSSTTTSSASTPTSSSCSTGTTIAQTLVENPIAAAAHAAATSANATASASASAVGTAASSSSKAVPCTLIGGSHKREASSRCNSTPPKRVPPAPESRHSPLPLDLYQRRIETETEASSLAADRGDCVSSISNIKQGVRSPTPSRASGTDISGTNRCNVQQQQQEDNDDDLDSSMGSPKRLVQHSTGCSINDNGRGLESVEKIEEPDDYDEGEPELEEDIDADADADADVDADADDNSSSNEVGLNMKISGCGVMGIMGHASMVAAISSPRDGGVGGGESESARSTPAVLCGMPSDLTHRPSSRSSRDGGGCIGGPSTHTRTPTERPSSSGVCGSLAATSGGLSPSSSTAVGGLVGSLESETSGLGPVQSVPLSLKKEIECSEDDNSSSRHMQQRSASAGGGLGNEMDYRASHKSLLQNFSMGSNSSSNPGSPFSARCPTPFAFPFTPLGLSLFDIDPSRILSMLHHQTWLAEETLRNRGLLGNPKELTHRFTPLNELLGKDYHANHFHAATAADLLSGVSGTATATSTALSSPKTNHGQSTQQQFASQQHQQYSFGLRYSSPAAAYFHHHHHHHQHHSSSTSAAAAATPTTATTYQRFKHNRPNTPSPSNQTATSTHSLSRNESLLDELKRNPVADTNSQREEDIDAVIELSSNDETPMPVRTPSTTTAAAAAAAAATATANMLYKDSLEQLLQQRQRRSSSAGIAAVVGDNLRSYTQMLLSNTPSCTTDTSSSCKEKSSSSSTSSTPPPTSALLAQHQHLSQMLKSPSETSSLFSEPIEEETRCVVCNAHFPNVWLLEQHAALQHPHVGPGEEKPFICEQCGQSYRYRSAYAKHKEQNHRARLPADKLFTCDVCGMQFRYLKSFKKHRLNHALERLHGKKGAGGKYVNMPQIQMEQDIVTSSQEALIASAEESGEDLRINVKREQKDDDEQEQERRKEEEQDNTIDSAGMALLYNDNNSTTSASTNSAAEPTISSSDVIHSTNKRPRLLTTTHMETDPSYQRQHQQHQQHQHQAHHHHLQQGQSLPPHLHAAAAAVSPTAVPPLHVAAHPATALNSLSSLNSITSLINAERIPSEQFLGLNPQEASILNFLRVDAAERQRDKRPPTSRFACPFCGKCVRSKENLKLHVRKHTGERPFVCLFCGRAFGGKSDLTRHLRIHTGERPYHCESCGKCFARADYLSKHLTTHIHNAPR